MGAVELGQDRFFLLPFHPRHHLSVGWDGLQVGKHPGEDQDGGGGGRAGRASFPKVLCCRSLEPCSLGNSFKSHPACRIRALVPKGSPVHVYMLGKACGYYLWVYCESKLIFLLSPGRGESTERLLLSCSQQPSSWVTHCVRTRSISLAEVGWYQRCPPLDSTGPFSSAATSVHGLRSGREDMPFIRRGTEAQR